MSTTTKTMPIDTILEKTGAAFVSLNVYSHGWEVGAHIAYADGSTGVITAEKGGKVRGSTIRGGVVEQQDEVEPDDRASVLKAVDVFRAAGMVS